MEITTAPDEPLAQTRLTWKSEKADTFESHLKEAISPYPKNPSAYISEVQIVCEHHFKARNSRPGRKQHWWCPEVEKARRDCQSARRLSTRWAKRHRSHCPLLLNQLRDARNRLKQSIIDAKALCLHKLLLEANADPWGNAYKICAVKSTKSAPLARQVS